MIDNSGLVSESIIEKSVPLPSGSAVPVKNLDLKHPEFKALQNVWTRLTLLYAGGWALKEKAELFLVRRPKEIGDVYQARLSNFTYHNHIGTALDWYSSELFEEDPHIQPNQTGADGKPAPKKLNTEENLFYNRFLLDCDRGGTSFVDTFRKVFSQVLLYKKSYVLMDLPSTTGINFPNQKIQKDSGALDPYLCVFSPLEAINWELDEYGNLNWIIFAAQYRISEPKIGSKVVDRWFFYDRQRFEVYERKHDEDEKSAPDKAVADLIDSGTHLMAKNNVVPVSVIEVPDGLWLANRALLAALSHLNTDNVLDWALFMAALCMPIIFSDSDVQPTLTEAGFIKLGKDDKYEWAEPQGLSFKHLADRLQELTENIFRSFYLIHQGRSGRATPTAQSGVSKQLDMMPSKDILKMFGDLLRAFMQQVLNMVAKAKGHAIEWDIRGFEFKEDISDAEVTTISDALALDIPSPTLEKEVHKRLAKALTPDANPSIHRQMFEEIDAAPDKVGDLPEHVIRAAISAWAQLFPKEAAR